MSNPTFRGLKLWRPFRRFDRQGEKRQEKFYSVYLS
jgi:hypothetical protein